MLKKLIFVFVSIIFFSSCIESNVSILIKNDFSGTADVTYVISGKSEYISSDLTSLRYQFLAIDEESLRNITDRNNTLVLKNYTYEEGGDTSKVSFSIDFSSPEEIEKLTSPGGAAPLLSIGRPENGKITVKLRSPFSGGTDEKTKSLLKALYGDNILSFRITIPGFITSTSIGELTEDPSSALLKLTFGQLIDNGEDIIWILDYTQSTGG